MLSNCWLGKQKNVLLLVGKGSCKDQRKVSWQKEHHHTVGREKIMIEPTEYRSAYPSPSNGRSGKILRKRQLQVDRKRSLPVSIGKLIGNALYRRPIIGRERYVGWEKAFRFGLSPTEAFDWQYSFPTNSCRQRRVFQPTCLSRLWCRGVVRSIE